MPHIWDNVTGQELSAFAASPSSLQLPQLFVKHLAQHGTYEDFCAHINQHKNPLHRCLFVQRAWKPAALQWLTEQLTTQSDPDVLANTHYQVVDEVVSGDLTKKILAHVDFTKMTPAHHIQLFIRLVGNGWDHLVETNRAVFEPVCATHPQKTIISATEMGLDTSCVAWTPKTSPQRGAYFIACCRGGFLEKAKALKVRSHEVVMEAFEEVLYYRTRSANTTAILEYLWDTYPNAPWSSNPHIGELLSKSLSLTQKMIEHTAHHNPQRLRNSMENICFHTIRSKNTAGLELLLPHISNEVRMRVLNMSIEETNPLATELLLSLFSSREHDLLLEKMPPPTKDCIQTALNNMQAKRLHAEVESGVTKTTLKRKM